MTDLFEEDEYSYELASKTSRYFAIAIDYAINTGFFILMATNFGDKYYTDGGGITYRVTGFPAFICFSFWFLIMPVLEAYTGQSLGKMLFKIKVLRQNGTKANLGNTTAKHLFDLIDFFPFFGIIGLIVASNNKLNQRVGDLVGKTIVVKK